MTSRIYGKVTSPSSFIEAFLINKSAIESWQEEYGIWDRFWGWKIVSSFIPIAPTTYSLCSYDENWTLEDKYNNPELSSSIWVRGTEGVSSGVVEIIDVTSIIPRGTFYYTGRYNEENQTFSLSPIGDIIPREGPPKTGAIRGAGVINYPYGDLWAFLTDNGSLETLSQFTSPSGIWEGIGTGSRINIRIKPEYPSSINVGGTIQLEAHGKEPLAWITSDEAIGKIDSNGLFTAVGKGTCSITVQDALGNIAVSGVITVR